MMKIVITALMAGTLAVAPDTIPATGGNITIQPINHATLELTYGGKVIDIDPVAQANFEGLAAPDIILVTDIHQDHLDPSTVAKRKKDTKLQITAGRTRILARCPMTEFGASSAERTTQSGREWAVVQRCCARPTVRSRHDRRNGFTRNSATRSFFGMLIRSIGGVRDRALCAIGL